MFSEKKYHEILEKSKEKMWYQAPDIKEEEDEPQFNSTERSQIEEEPVLEIKNETQIDLNIDLNDKSLTDHVERLMREKTIDEALVQSKHL